MTLAYCWAHCRRKFYEIAEAGHAPIAEGEEEQETVRGTVSPANLRRIAAIYAAEAELRGQPPDSRRAGRQARTRPILEALRPWLEMQLAPCPASPASPRRSATP